MIFFVLWSELDVIGNCFLLISRVSPFHRSPAVLLIRYGIINEDDLAFKKTALR